MSTYWQEYVSRVGCKISKQESCNSVITNFVCCFKLDVNIKMLMIKVRKTKQSSIILFSQKFHRADQVFSFPAIKSLHSSNVFIFKMVL